MINIMKKSGLLVLTMLLMMFLLALNINQTYAYHNNTTYNDIEVETGVEVNNEMYKIFEVYGEDGFSLDTESYYTVGEVNGDYNILERYHFYVYWQGLDSPEYTSLENATDYTSTKIYHDPDGFGDVSWDNELLENDIENKPYYQMTFKLKDTETNEYLSHMQPFIDEPFSFEISFFDGNEMLSGLWQSQDFVSDFEQQEQENITMVQSLFGGLIEISNSFIALMATMFNDVFGLFYDGTITLLGTLVLIPLSVGAFYGILRMIINMLQFRTKG